MTRSRDRKASRAQYAKRMTAPKRAQLSKHALREALLGEIKVEYIWVIQISTLACRGERKWFGKR